MTKPETTSASTQIKRESKSFEAVQEAVLLGILNYHGYSIEIKHPERLAEKTVQFLIVKELIYDNEPLGFGNEIESICSERYEGEKNEASTIKKVRQTRRHKDINKAALTFNRLLKIVEENGYTVKRRYTKSSYKTLRMEKITDILKNDKIIIDTAQMSSLGKAINNVIIKTFKKGPYKTTMIEMRNEIIMGLMKQIPHFKNDNLIIKKEENDETVEDELESIEMNKGMIKVETLEPNDLPEIINTNDFIHPNEKMEMNEIPEPIHFDPSILPQSIPYSFENIPMYDITQYSLFGQDQPNMNQMHQQPIMINPPHQNHSTLFTNQFYDVPFDRIYDITNERVKQIQTQQPLFNQNQMNQTPSFQPINLQPMNTMQQTSLPPIHGVNQLNQIPRNSLMNKSIENNQQNNQIGNKNEFQNNLNVSNNQNTQNISNNQTVTPNKGKNPTTYNLMFKPIEPDASFPQHQQNQNQPVYQNVQFQQKFNSNVYN